MIELSTLVDIYSNWIIALNGVWTWLNTDLSLFSQHINPNDFVDYPLFQSVILLFGFSNFSILELMLGAGLSFYLSYRVIKFFLDLVF